MLCQQTVYAVFAGGGLDEGNSLSIALGLKIFHAFRLFENILIEQGEFDVCMFGIESDQVGQRARCDRVRRAREIGIQCRLELILQHIE